MREAPYFSIVIPTYNRQYLLNEAIDSVVNQVFTDWQLIVVDDCSPIPMSIVTDPRITLLRNEENRGKSASINRALKSVNGKFVCVLDDDDLYGPFRLLHAFLAHELGGDVAICGRGEMGREGEGDGISESLTIRLLSSIEVSRTAETGHAACVTVRREMFPEYDESYMACQDVDWRIRLLDKKPSVSEISSPDWLWRRHDGERHGNGEAARLAGLSRIVIDHADYYARNPIQKSRRLWSLGYLQLNSGLFCPALRSGLSSIRVRPNAQAMRLIARSFHGMVWSHHSGV